MAACQTYFTTEKQDKNDLKCQHTNHATEDFTTIFKQKAA